MKKVVFVLLVLLISGCNSSGANEKEEAPNKLSGVWEGSVSYTCTDRILTDERNRVEAEIKGVENISLSIVDENGELSGTINHSYNLSNPKGKGKTYTDEAEFEIDGRYAKPVANISTQMIRFDAGRDNNRETPERDLEVEASASVVSFEALAAVCQGEPNGDFVNDYTLEKR
jgi:hypothetical protein